MLKKNIDNAINKIDLKDCERWIDIKKGIEKRIERLEEIKQELKEKLPNTLKESKIEFEAIGEETIIPNELDGVIQKIKDTDKYISENINDKNLESLINTFKKMETKNIDNKNDNIPKIPTR